MAGYSLVNSDDERLPSFKTPSLPLKMGYALDSVLMLPASLVFLCHSQVVFIFLLMNRIIVLNFLIYIYIYILSQSALSR